MLTLKSHFSASKLVPVCFQVSASDPNSVQIRKNSSARPPVYNLLIFSDESDRVKNTANLQDQTAQKQKASLACLITESKSFVKNATGVKFHSFPRRAFTTFGTAVARRQEIIEFLSALSFFSKTLRGHFKPNRKNPYISPESLTLLSARPCLMFFNLGGIN